MEHLQDHTYSSQTGDVLVNEERPEYLQRFDSIITEFMKEQGIPGASLALSHNGRNVYTQGYGKAGSGRPVLSTTAFRIASISKPITAIVTLKLWQDGKLSLQQKVFGPKGILNEYKPSSKGDRRLVNITVEHLLQHSAGWDRDQAGDPVFWNLEKVSKGMDPHSKEALVHYMMTKKLQFAPGKRHSYSNLGYLVLGMVIEHVTDMPYMECVNSLGEAVRDKIFVGHAKQILCDYMESEYFNNREEQLLPSVLPGEGLVVPQYGSFAMEDTGAYGGLVTSAVHLLNLFDCVSGCNLEMFTNIIEPETFHRMIQRPVYEPDTSEEWYGLGLDVQDGGSSWGHTGAMEGTSATYFHHKSGFSWVLLLNSWSRDMDIDGLVKYALSQVSVWDLWEPNAAITNSHTDLQVISANKEQIVHLLVPFEKFTRQVGRMRDERYRITSFNMCVHQNQLLCNTVYTTNTHNTAWKVLHNTDSCLPTDIHHHLEQKWRVVLLDICLFGKDVFFVYVLVLNKETSSPPQILSLHKSAEEHLIKMASLKSEGYDIAIQSVCKVEDQLMVSAVFEQTLPNSTNHKTTSWLQITANNFVYELSKQVKQGLGVRYLKFYTDGDFASVSVIWNTHKQKMCLQRHHVSRFGFLYEMNQSAKNNVPLLFLCAYYNEGVLNFAAVWESSKTAAGLKPKHSHSNCMIGSSYNQMDDATDDEKESPRNKDNSANRINLTRIRSAYSEKTHNESNLPNVLGEYGLEKKDSKLHDREKAEKKKYKSSGNKYVEDEESKLKRRKKREERYSQMIEDHQNMPEGSQYYSKKISGMMTRLANSEEHPSLRKDVQPEPKVERHVFVKRMEKHVLTNNNSFLRDLPKSEMAKVIELQDRLVKEGKLKSQSDIDHFREEIKKPEVFDSYLKKSSKQSDTGSQVSVQTDSKASHKPADIPPRSLSHISESSRPVTREDWAVTHQFPHRNDEMRQTSRRQAQLDLEKRFPKPMMPPLKCFTMELGEKPPDPQELQRQAELRVRVKQRKKFLRKLQRMHQMAMAHGAAASRILEKHGEIANILEGTTLRDVISVLPKPEDQYISEEELQVAEPGQQLALEDRLASRGSTRSSLTSHGSSLRSLHSRGSRKSDSRGSQRGVKKPIQWTGPKTLPSKPAPLTMDEIREKTKIIEAKCLSTNWINYMKAGKPQQSIPAS